MNAKPFESILNWKHLCVLLPGIVALTPGAILHAQEGPAVSPISLFIL